VILKRTITRPPELGSLHWPAKNKKFFDRFRYDNEASRRRWTWATIAHNLDEPMVRLTGWSLMSYLFQPRGEGRLEPPVLLKTIGSKTGAIRPKVLSAFSDGPGRWIVVGSNGALANHPGWVNNLRRDPNCWVTYLRKTYNVRAEEIAGEDRDRVIADISRRHPILPSYIEKAGDKGRAISFWRLHAR
jgi:deazaflavin-dependent oxidoreductase (nitroreductase family)